MQSLKLTLHVSLFLSTSHKTYTITYQQARALTRTLLLMSINPRPWLCTHIAYIKVRRGGRVDWPLGSQRCGCGFESQWQWERSAIISEAVFRFLITPLWFPRVTPVSSTNKKAAEVKFEIGNIIRARYFLSLHIMAGAAGSRNALTSYRLTRTLIKIQHLFIYFI